MLSAGLRLPRTYNLRMPLKSLRYAHLYHLSSFGLAELTRYNGATAHKMISLQMITPYAQISIKLWRDRIYSGKSPYKSHTHGRPSLTGRPDTARRSAVSHWYAGARASIPPIVSFLMICTQCQRYGQRWFPREDHSGRAANARWRHSPYRVNDVLWKMPLQRRYWMIEVRPSMGGAHRYYILLLTKFTQSGHMPFLFL